MESLEILKLKKRVTYFKRTLKFQTDPLLKLKLKSYANNTLKMCIMNKTNLRKLIKFFKHSVNPTFYQEKHGYKHTQKLS